MRTYTGMWTTFVLALASVGMGQASCAEPRLEDVACRSVADVQASVVVVQAEPAELDKINRDFGMAYRLKDVTLSYKEPDKFRMESKLGLLVCNGPDRYFRVPKLGISRKDSDGDAPGRQHSMLDVGVLTPATIGALNAKYLREENLGDCKTLVFSIEYRKDSTSRYLVWVDPKTRVIRQRHWLDGAGKLRAVFAYSELKEVEKGIWLPTRLEVRNAEGKLAGVTAYRDVKVNQKLPESLFTIA